MRYIWDDDKAKENIRNHRVTFEEAETIRRSPLNHVSRSRPFHQ